MVVCCCSVFANIGMKCCFVTVAMVTVCIQPHVRVWDSVSLTTLYVIGMGDFDRAVSSLAFSKTVSVAKSLSFTGIYQSRMCVISLYVAP